MKLLFDDRFRPITSTIGFIATQPDAAADSFMSWMGPIQARRQVVLQKQPLHEPLDRLLSRLLPLTSVERRRYLFIPTKSQWTAFLDNGYRGTDAFSVLSFLSKRMGVQSCTVTAIRSNAAVESDLTKFDALGFEIYEPVDTDFLNYGRTLNLSSEDGKWVFTNRGTPFPFEETASYSLPNLRERLTLDVLTEYLHHLGIDAFDEDFYIGAGGPAAIFLGKQGPTAPKLEEFTLTQAQRGKRK
jgi:hypothetical protein